MTGKATRTAEERFWEKVDKDAGPGECYGWLGAVSPKGYGMFWLDGHLETAHRAAYKMFVGPVADDEVVDHVAARGCTRRDCTNTDHLEPVSNQENLRRGRRPWSDKTHCKFGHPLSGDNIYAQSLEKYGRRQCVTCARKRAREALAKARRRAA